MSQGSQATEGTGERRPLMPIVPIPTGHLPDLRAEDGLAMRVLKMPLLALEYHYLGILSTIVSAWLCAHVGYAEVSVIDPVIFKSIFVIFGFTMGFRNVRANQRYFDSMEASSLLYAAFWGIYSPLPVHVRLKLQSGLLECIKEATAHIHRIGGNHRWHWYGIVGLEPASHKHEVSDVEALGYGATDANVTRGRSLSHASSWLQSPGGTRGAWRARSFAPTHLLTNEGLEAAVLSPRTEFLLILLDCEKEIEVLETGREQKLKRGFWRHKDQLLTAYDRLLALAFPSVTDRFMTFVDICLFFFAISLPWGIVARKIEIVLMGHYIVIPAVAVLMVNTTLVVAVLFCLNALTVQNENPLSGDGDDVDLHRLSRVLECGVAAFERHERLASEIAAASPGSPDSQDSDVAFGSIPRRSRSRAMREASV